MGQYYIEYPDMVFSLFCGKHQTDCYVGRVRLHTVHVVGVSPLFTLTDPSGL